MGHIVDYLKSSIPVPADTMLESISESWMADSDKILNAQYTDKEVSDAINNNMSVAVACSRNLTEAQADKLSNVDELTRSILITNPGISSSMKNQILRNYGKVDKTLIVTFKADLRSRLKDIK